MRTEVDRSDVQGLVRTGFGSMTEGCYYLLAIQDAAAARTWLRAVSDKINNAVGPSAKAPGDEWQTDCAMQVAFTSSGLQKLGVPKSTEDGFSVEFLSGMSGEANRSRRLGDMGKNKPEGWSWGGPGNVPDVLVMLFTKNGLARWTKTVKGALWAAAFRELTCLDTSHLPGDVEPFGFKDGISQPTIDFKQTREPASEELDFGNLVAAGEFLLGYQNEYKKFTERPLIDAKDDPKNILASAEGDRGRHDFGLNGTYLVFRDLAQDVSGFWQFIGKQADGNRGATRQLGASIVGRTIEGQPLVPLSEDPIPGIDPEDAPYNRFTFDGDPEGRRCPIGAHVRRANPRTADYPPGTKGLWGKLSVMLGVKHPKPQEDLVSSTRFHRVLRRGREYGPELTPDAAVIPGPADGLKRGLRFICLNANISRQFEFVQQAWVTGTKFAGLTEQSDPLLGNRSPVAGCLPTDTFSIPEQAGLARCLTGIGQFVTVNGGGYFFLPSMRALRYITSIGS